MHTATHVTIWADLNFRRVVNTVEKLYIPHPESDFRKAESAATIMGKSKWKNAHGKKVNGKK